MVVNDNDDIPECSYCYEKMKYNHSINNDRMTINEDRI